MKNSLTGLICTCLLAAAGSVSARAQDKKPDPQPTDPAAAVSAQASSSGPATPAQDASADQAAPAQQTAPPPPAAGQAPQQQTPPAGTTTPPVAQTPTPPDVQPTQHGRIAEPPPPPPKIPDVRRPGESGFWIGVEGWVPKQHPTFNKGNASTFTDSSLIKLQGSPKVAEHVEIGAAAGLHNTLRLDYTQFRASGNFTTPIEVATGSQTYTAGTYIATSYRVQNIRLSYEYLTWPYPVGSRKFRFKTLYQLQYTQINAGFDSPLKYYDANGNLLVDSTTGNPINLADFETFHIFSPMLGVGTYYYPSRHLRFEANGTGFAIPHHYTIWDADGSLNLRVTGHFEVRLGGRAFAYKSSTGAAFFMKGTFASAFFGVRWYSNSE